MKYITRTDFDRVFSIDRILSYFSSNLFLFLSCAGIWGSTWIVIKYQISGAYPNSPDPVISVFYRFFIATALLFSFAKIKKLQLSYSKKQHLNFFLQGSCNFSINYIITYWAEQYATSAVVAITFTLLVAYNILGMKFFYNKKIGPNVYIGSLLGIIGVLFIFGHELIGFYNGNTNLKGLGLGVIATLFASAGNLLSHRNHLNQVPVTISNAWGMFYGTLMTLFIALILKTPFTFSMPPSYWCSLLYLSVFGTVFAFGAYLTLVGRIGAEKASYTSILSPVIAVILSTLFENFNISVYMILGLIFCLIGNLITLQPKTKFVHYFLKI